MSYRTPQKYDLIQNRPPLENIPVRTVLAADRSSVNFSRMSGSWAFQEPSMSELTKSLVLAGAFVAFILAAYMQEGGSWRGPHSLRKSLHPKDATLDQQDRPWVPGYERGR
jgi:hypothetical protein